MLPDRVTIWLTTEIFDSPSRSHGIVPELNIGEAKLSLHTACPVSRELLIFNRKYK